MFNAACVKKCNSKFQNDLNSFVISYLFVLTFLRFHKKTGLKMLMVLNKKKYGILFTLVRIKKKSKVYVLLIDIFIEGYLIGV
jgi:hypothetical protein